MLDSYKPKDNQAHKWDRTPEREFDYFTAKVNLEQVRQDYWQRRAQKIMMLAKSDKRDESEEPSPSKP